MSSIFMVEQINGVEYSKKMYKKDNCLDKGGGWNKLFFWQNAGLCTINFGFTYHVTWDEILDHMA